MKDENRTNNTCMYATQEGSKMREPGTEVGLETVPRDIVFYAFMKQSLSKQFCKRLASLTECFFVPLAGSLLAGYEWSGFESGDTVLCSWAKRLKLYKWYRR